MRTIRDVMSTEVVTVGPTASLRDAAQLLVDHRISGLPVVDDAGAVVGVISEADFVSAAGRPGSVGGAILRLLLGDGRHEVRGSVGEVMSTHPRTVDPDLPVAQAAALMSRWKVNRLPVVDGSRLVGIITRADIVRTFTQSDRELTGSVREAVSRFPEVEVVEVRGGIAVLRGRVEHRLMADAATTAAGQTPGIVGVDASALQWEHGFQTE